MQAGLSMNSKIKDLVVTAFIVFHPKVGQQMRVEVRQIALRCSNPADFLPYYKVYDTILEST